MEERSLNRSKRGKIGKNLRSRHILGRPVDRFKQKLSAAVLVSGTVMLAFGKLKPISFSARLRRGNLAYSFLDFFGYLRTSKTHLQGIQKHSKPRIEERVKKKRKASGQFQISALLLQVSALFTSSISSNLIPS